MKTNELTPTPRERVSVAITGIDRSTPDVIVEDGKCEKLHNARYSGGAWRPVHEHKAVAHLLEEISAEFDIVYHHPAAGDNTYIARYKDEPETFVTITFHEDEQPTINAFATVPKVVKISHFGNVLMFSDGDDVSYFYLKNGEYTHFVIPEPPKVKSITKKLYPIRPWKYTQGNGWKDFPKDRTDVSPDTYMRVAWPIADMMTGSPKIPLTPDATYEDAINSWHGEVAFFAAYEMVDGTIIAPSLMSIVASERELPNNTRVVTSNAYGEDSKLLAIEQNGPASGDATYWEDAAMQFIVGEAQYTLPTNINTELITNIVCFCTRINSIFDYGKIIPSEQSYSGVNIAYANNNLPTQPFYLLASKPLSTSTTLAVFNLNAKGLANIETNRVYQPNNNIHLTIGNVSLDYNNGLHLADVTTKLFEGYNAENFISPSSEAELIDYTVAVSLEINNALHFSKRIDTLHTIPASPRPAPRIITYPDYRAKQFFFQHSENITSAFDLVPAAANNVAYFLPTPTSLLKYPEISFAADLGTYKFPDSNTFTLSNRIQVSATNNCFSFPFENSYSVGSSNNRIIALQSAAIEMPEMKVGELPLYAFTEEGIFALIAGSETLYARVSAINYDKIINPNTLAINGAIAYITEKGVHLLTGSGSQVISTPIHDKANRPPLDFLRTCKMIYPKEHNEIILHNEDNGDGTAYVYNLDNGYWSTRTLNGRKLNTDEMYYGGTLYDLANEDENEAMDIKIVTRPIKLGDVEFKRIESVVPRIASNDHAFSMDIDITGSVDGGDYHRLRSESLDIAPNKVNPITIRRTPFSAKYFKMDFLLYPLDTDDDTFNSSFNPSFSHVDIEWYRKLRHRMR